VAEQQVTEGRSTSSSIVDIVGPFTEEQQQQQGGGSSVGIDAVSSYGSVDAVMDGRDGDGDDVEDMSQPPPSISSTAADDVQEQHAVTAGKERDVVAVGADKRHDESMLSVVNLSALNSSSVGLLVVQTDDLLDVEPERDNRESVPSKGEVATTTLPLSRDRIDKEKEREDHSDNPGPSFSFSDSESSDDDDRGKQQLAIGSLPKRTYFRGGLHGSSNNHRMQNNKAIAEQMKQVESVISPSRKSAAAAASPIGGNHLDKTAQGLQSMELGIHSYNNSPAARSTASSQQLSWSSNQWKSAKGSSSPDAFASAALYSPSGNHHKMTFNFSEQHSIDDEEPIQGRAEEGSVLDIVEEANSKPSAEASFLKQQQQVSITAMKAPSPATAVSPLASSLTAGRTTRHEALSYSTTSSTDEEHEDKVRNALESDDDDDDDDDDDCSSSDEVSSKVSSKVRRTTNQRVFSQQKAPPREEHRSLLAVDLLQDHRKHTASKRAPTDRAENTRSSSTIDSQTAVDGCTESNRSSPAGTIVSSSSRGLHHHHPDLRIFPLGGAPSASSPMLSSLLPLGEHSSFMPSSLSKPLPISGSRDHPSITLQTPLEGPCSSLRDGDGESAMHNTSINTSLLPSHGGHSSTAGHGSTLQRTHDVIAGPSDVIAPTADRGPGRLFSIEQFSSPSSPSLSPPHHEGGGGVRVGGLMNEESSSLIDDRHVIALKDRINILEAQAKLSAEREVTTKLGLKEREEFWLAEIAALRIALDRMGADKQQQDRELCELRLASTTQAAVIESLEAGKKTLTIEASMFQRKADRQALSTVLSQQKLISALETSLAETQQQVRRLEQELSELNAVHLDTVSSLNHLRAMTMAVESNTYSPPEDLIASSGASSSSSAASSTSNRSLHTQRQLVLVEDVGLQALTLSPSSSSQESKDGYRFPPPGIEQVPTPPLLESPPAVADETTCGINAFRSVAKHNIQQ